MNFVKIAAWEKALVYRNGALTRILSEGNHYIGFSEKIVRYNMLFQIPTDTYINALLTNATFLNEVEIIMVNPGEIALCYVEGMFDKILTAGRYIFWKGGVNQRFEIISLNSGMIAKEQLPLLTYAVFNPYVVVLKVESHEKAILYEDGRFSAILEPGAYYFWKGQTTYTVSRVDQRAIQQELSGQEILTKDKATIRLTVFSNYRVVDMRKAIIENKDFEKQVYVLIQLVLREFVGNLTLDQILEVREKLTDNITEQVTNQLERLGIELLGLGIRDIILPGDMKEIMNQVLIAEKKAQANVIMRREETASTRSLLNTAKIMEENQMVWKLKEMEYVERIAERVSHIQLSGAGPLTDQLKNLFVNKNNNSL